MASLTFVPWSSGKALCWDVTVTCPLADSYINAAARESDAAAELAASRKEEKYTFLDWRYIFEPIAIKILGVLNIAHQLLCDLEDLWEHRGSQRNKLSVSKMLGACATFLLYDILSAYECTNWKFYQFFLFSVIFRPHRYCCFTSSRKHLSYTYSCNNVFFKHDP